MPCSGVNVLLGAADMLCSRADTPSGADNMLHDAANTGTFTAFTSEIENIFKTQSDENDFFCFFEASLRRESVEIINQDRTRYKTKLDHKN